VWHNDGMPKRSRMPTDLNSLAARITGMATSDVPTEVDGKDPAAVALGRKGGVKGGPERARRLTPEQRKEIARKGAAARWGKDTGEEKDV